MKIYILLLALLSQIIVAGVVILPEKESENIIVFATSPDSMAFDRTDNNPNNSPFTTALLTALEKNNLTITEVLKETQLATERLTSNKQSPWFYSTSRSNINLSNISSQQKIALIIGNQSYGNNSLNNPKNDALAINEMLKNKGFRTTVLLDSNYKNMSLAIEKIKKQLTKDSTFLFYYSGHGAKLKGDNYLLPINVNINTNLVTNSIHLENMISSFSLAESKNIFVLDACFPFTKLETISSPILIKKEKDTIVEASITKEKPYIVDELISTIFLNNIEYKFLEKIKLIGDNIIEITLNKNDFINTENSLIELDKEIVKNFGKKYHFIESFSIKLKSTSLVFKPITSHEQCVTAFGSTTWRWLVQPKKTGKAKFFINIDAILEKNGNKTIRSIYNKEQSIEIEESFLDRIIRFLSENWTFILSTILIPMFIWGLAFRKKEKPLNVILQKREDDEK